MSAPFGVFEYSGTFDYPSPAVTSFDAPSYSNASYPSFRTTQSMPPPSAYPTPSNRQYTEPPEPIPSTQQRSYSANSPPTTSDAYSPPCISTTQPYSPFGLPLTPTSTGGIDDVPLQSTSAQTQHVHLPADPRRLSVQSLLSGPSSDGSHGRQYPIGYEEFTIYGYDTGLPDLDMPQNDDRNPIAISSPPIVAMDMDGDRQSATMEPRGKDMAFEKGGYYAKPVPIKISKSLEPLPPVSV